MSTLRNNGKIYVPISEASLGLIYAAKRDENEKLALVIERVLREYKPTKAKPANTDNVAKPKPCKPISIGYGKHQVQFLGETIKADTLGRLFANVIDVVDATDPECLERFASKRTHARYFISRDKNGIHLKSPHLETIHSKSGWWVSDNVSSDQVGSALRLLCKTCGLAYGKDLVYRP